MQSNGGSNSRPAASDAGRRGGDPDTPQDGARSLLSPIGYQSGDCGYCKAEDSSASYFARSQSLTPKHYQELMDRGWRRSGSLLYLPDVSRSCCPHYTIRLPAAEYKSTRDQRQALNRWNRYVLGERYLQQVKIKYPKTKEEKKRSANEVDLALTVHEAERENVKPDIKPDHDFLVGLEHDDYTEEKFALFQNYQQHVHHEGPSDITKIGFRRFLCSSPVHRTLDSDGKQLGSFHQCYRLNGRLIAMAVLDLLPHAVSGVYFIYHSDFEKWSFGKLSAVREATLALEQNYRFYYMGYYIHSCKKMRYKGDYRPQYVLDLENLQWDPLDDAMREVMDKRKFASMSKERARIANEQQGISEDEEEIMYPDPQDAMGAVNGGVALVEMKIPGVLTADQLHEQVDLDTLKIYLGENIPVFETQDTNGWESRTGLYPIIADLAATVGPNVAREICLHFSVGS